jgi:hypothetical protein
MVDKRSANINAASMSFLATIILLPGPARAMSALVAGIPDDVAHHGLAIGIAHDRNSRSTADAEALKKCLSFIYAPAETRALCKVIAHFDKQCLSVSFDPKPSTPGYGWAIADTAIAANNQALQNCRDTAGADRVAYCEISETDCDTQP